jgi:ketosteroid isomerase-like protein
MTDPAATFVHHIKRWISLAMVCAIPANARAAADADAHCRNVDKDESAVAELDTQYQKAVKENDAETIDRIVAADFVLVTGRGTTFHKIDLLNDARSKTTVYEHQEDSNRTVRVCGDTAIVTALLWAKGTSGGNEFEYKLWFSDVYLRTRNGWQYAFAQASIPLPK